MKGKILTLFLSVLLLGCYQLRAQESRGTILGRVADATGAVIPNVSVTVTNTDTGVSTVVETNAQGIYHAPYLIPGPYRITAEKQVMKRLVRPGITVRVGDRLEVNLQLELGQLAEQITVTDEAPLVDTTNSSVGQVVDSRRIAELPIAHGNAYHLIQLSPGVAFARAHTLDRSYEPTHIIGYSMSGTRSNRTDLMIDGAPVTATAGAGEITAAYVPPADAISEFRVETTAFDASYGQTEGGAVNISLKAGTNALHGSAYWAKMDPALNANLFFSNRIGTPRGDFNYNRWGTSLGGPVYLPKLYDGRNRTFFMHAYEGIHESRPRGATLTVPTEKQRGGDLSDLLSVGPQYQIHDPATRRMTADGRFQSDPLPGNIIPTHRINEVGKNILSYFGLPNTKGEADGRNNLALPNEPENTAYFNHTARVDHNLSDRHRFFVRASTYTRNSTYFDWFKNEASGEWFAFRARNAALDDVYVFDATTVMNIRYGFNRLVRDRDGRPSARGFDLTKLGFPAEYNAAIPASVRRFPLIYMDGYADTWRPTSYRPVESHSLNWTLDKVAGAHTLRFGFEHRRYRENQLETENSASGAFGLGSDWTLGPYDTSAPAPLGQSLASMLLGLPTWGYIDRVDSYAEQSTVWAGYVHDVWKVTPRLTINAGLRYEVEGPLTERLNRSVRGADLNAVHPFDATVRANYAANPIPELPPDRFLPRGGLTFAGVGGQPRTLWERDVNNFMPRVAAAWQLGSKTVLRGGYGLFYGFLGTRRGDVIQTGFSRSTELTPTMDGLVPYATLSNPYPDGILEPTGSSLGTMTNVGQSISFFNTRPQSPLMQRWQVGIQRELPARAVLEISYIGNRGSDIETTRNLNALPNQYLSKSPVRDQETINYLAANFPNPFYPLLPGTSRAGKLITRATLLTRYPQFTSVSTTTNEGKSWYDALQVRLEKRLSRGLTFQAGYTWSKLIEATGFLNAGDPAPERVISDQDYTQRLSLSWIYELPFGRGRRWLSQAHPLVREVFGGWQVQGILQAQSGQALGFGNMIYYGDLKEIPLPVGERTPDRWFNTEAPFERASNKQLASNLRTVSTRFSGVRGDGINNWDLSAMKYTTIKENVRLQIRADFLNAFNHVMFSNPNTSVTSSAFGKITSEKGYPRRIQMSVRLVF